MGRHRVTVALLCLCLLLVLSGFALVTSAPPLDSDAPRTTSDGVERPTPAAGGLVGPVEVGMSRLAADLSARNAMRAAWRLARAAGPYGFSADVTQEVVPLALPENAGRSSRAQRYYLEGTAEPASRHMELTLWAQGGSVLDVQDRVEMRVEGDRVLARQGNGAWEEAPDVTGWLAPQGDVMAFLAATKNARDVGEETRNGVTVRRYRFDLDGPRFAEYVRGEMERALREGGKLPPGVSLEVPQAYQGMTGHGELWLDAAGLPRRQIIHAEFAPPGDYRLRADMTITFDFSGGGTLAQLPSETPAAPQAAAAPLTAPVRERGGAAPQWLPSLVFVAAVGAAGLLALRGARSRRAHALLAMVLVLAMVATPLLQAERVVALAQQQSARQASQREDTERERAAREAQAAFATNAWDAHRNPLAEDTEAALGETTVITEPVTLSSAQADEVSVLYRQRQAALLADPQADADGDGLTDAEEQALGTSSDTADYDLDGVPDGRDSDGDGLSDAVEVAGFTHGGKRWYLDPLAADTNGDSLADLLEWGPGDAPLDTDADGVPDLFDRDNDNDGVPDRLDLSPFSASARLGGGVDAEGRPAASATPSGYTFHAKYPNALESYSDDVYPLIISMRSVPPAAVTYLDLQLRPTDANHLWYAYNVLDWPSGDDKGQVQDVDGATLFDACVSQATASGEDPAEACALNPDGNGDIKLVPMLEFRFGKPLAEALALFPEPDVLAAYGISVQATDGASGQAVAYVPLQLITDEDTGERVAFGGRMLFRKPSYAVLSPEVNLVWRVQGLSDNVCVERDDAGACTRRANNVRQVIASYPDDWCLTALDMQVNYGVDYAILYEDPAVDPDPADDAALFMLQDGLEASFLAGRATNGARDVTVAELARRFNHATNDAVSDTERWGIPSILSVTTGSASDADRAAATIAMTDTLKVLSAAYGTAPTKPVTPTLLFAREETSASFNLDSGYGQPSWDEYSFGARVWAGLAGAP